MRPSILLLLALASGAAYSPVAHAAPALDEPVPAPETTAAIIQRAEQLRDKGQFAAAQTLLEVRLKGKTTTDENKALQFALSDVHYSWARTLAQQYDFIDAIRHYQAAYTIDKTVRLHDAGADLNSIGLAYENMGQYGQAIGYYKRALPILHASKDTEGEATTLCNIGVVYYNLGQYEQSLIYYQQAVPILHKLNKRVDEATTLNKIGGIYDNLSRTEQALHYYQQALPIWHAAGDGQKEVTTLNHIGLAYNSLSQYGQSLNCYKQALPICRRIKDGEDEAAILNNIGSVYDDLSRYEQALIYYKQALPILRRLEDRADEATTLNNIGVAYEHLNQYDKALSCYRQALPILRYRKDRAGEATTLNNIGMVYRRMSRYEQALIYYKQALPVFRELKDRADEAVTLNNIGMVYHHLNRYEQALTYYQQALPVYREIKYRVGESITLNNLMFFAKGQRHLALAILYGKQAINLKQVIRRNMQGLDRESQRTYLQANRDTYDTLAALLIQAGRLPEAEQVMRMLRQEELLDFTSRDATLNGLTELLSFSPQEQSWIQTYDALLADDSRLRVRATTLQLKGSRRTPAQNAEFIAVQTQQTALTGHWKAFKNDIAQADAHGSPPVIDVAESAAWQQKLADLEQQGAGRAALLTTVISDDKFYVIMSTAQGHRQFSYPIKSADLNVLVARFRQTLTDPNLDPVPLAQQLYKVVFCDGKLRQALDSAGISRALWFLNGTLRYVPFAALHDGKGYLVEQTRQNVAISLSSRQYLDVPADGPALGVGTSLAHTVSMQQNGQSEPLEFDKLAGVPAELRGIISDAKHGGQGPLTGNILLDSDFTAQALQAALEEGCKTVHVATHFMLTPGDESRSFLLLGDGSPLLVPDLESKLNWKGVQLLTLSACETGVGGDTSQAATGKEISGLGEVAQHLGVCAIVASLWPVADSSTSQLMRDFYTQWHAHPEAGKGAALRAAQLSLLNGTAPIPNTAPLPVKARSDRASRLTLSPNAAPPAPTFHPDPAKPFAHPYYWAPFFLTGNWR